MNRGFLARVLVAAFIVMVFSASDAQSGGLAQQLRMKEGTLRVSKAPQISPPPQPQFDPGRGQPIPMPDFVGTPHSFDQANQKLLRLHHSAKMLSGKHQRPAGEIYHQDPPEDTDLRTVDRVLLYVSEGPETTVVTSTAEPVNPTATVAPTASQTLRPKTPAPTATTLPTNTIGTNSNRGGGGGDELWWFWIIGGGLIFGGGASATVLRKLRVRKWRQVIRVTPSLSSKVETSAGPISMEGPPFSTEAGVHWGEVEFKGPIAVRVEERDG